MIHLTNAAEEMRELLQLQSTDTGIVEEFLSLIGVGKLNAANGRDRQQQHNQRHASKKNDNSKEHVQLNSPKSNKHHGGQQKYDVSNTKDQKRQDASTTLAAISHVAKKKDSTRRGKYAHSGQHNHSKGVAPVNTHPPMPMPGTKKDHRPEHQSHNDTNEASHSKANENNQSNAKRNDHKRRNHKKGENGVERNLSSQKQHSEVGGKEQNESFVKLGATVQPRALFLADGLFQHDEAPRDY